MYFRPVWRFKPDGKKDFPCEVITYTFTGTTGGNTYIDFDVSDKVSDCFRYTWQAENQNTAAYNGLVVSIECTNVYAKTMRINLVRAAGACSFKLIGIKY